MAWTSEHSAFAVDVFKTEGSELQHGKLVMLSWNDVVPDRK